MKIILQDNAENNIISDRIRNRKCFICGDFELYSDDTILISQFISDWIKNESQWLKPILKKFQKEELPFCHWCFNNISFANLSLEQWRSVNKNGYTFNR